MRCMTLAAELSLNDVISNVKAKPPTHTSQAKAIQRLPNLAPAPPQPQQPQTARPRAARASSSRKYATNHALVGVNHQAKSKFIETHFDRAEWLDGTTFEADDINIDLGSRTNNYFSSYHFGNLPSSSGIKANHYPAVAQQSQLHNYYAKNNWAMMTANDRHGVDSMTKAWADTLKKARQLDLPDWIRPTELQVFVPHLDMLDCISWPYFQDYVIQHPEMQHGELQWLAACTSGVQVEWDGAIEDALCIDGPTGRRRFTAEAETTIRDLQKWSLAASYRAFMPGIDGQIPIRTAEDTGVKLV
ncbi:conidial development fluffy [Fusarium coicis]|nr:conidial development fluffy [Fusarium coicis]